MTDQTAAENPTPPSGNQRPRRCGGRGRAAFFVLLIAIAAGLTGALVTRAYSQGFGPPWHAGAFFGPFDPARAEDRADRMVRHLAIEVDATAEQQDKLRAIVKAAVKDLLPMREKAQGFRDRGRELLTQTAVDRAAIEALRADQMALADQASRRVSQALADAATVLTPEQRRKIADHMAARRGFMHGRHRG